MIALADLDHFLNCPLLVVGDLMLDEFVWGSVQRISPEAPVPVVEVQRQTFVAGGAANTAANLGSLSARAMVAGVVGTDSEGQRIIQLLQSLGLDTTPIISDSLRPTTTKTRVIAHNQQVVRIDRESPGPLSAQIESQLLARVSTALPHVRGVVLSDYGKGVLTASICQQVIEGARHTGIPVVVDPKGTDYTRYRGATLIKPNQLEAGKVLNRELRTNEDVNRAGAELARFLGVDSALLITRGAQGMTLFRNQSDPISIPTQAREVYDVTGAGDTVAATIAVALAVGRSLTTACHLASLAAAVVVGKLGTATCTYDELRSAVLSTQGPSVPSQE